MTIEMATLAIQVVTLGIISANLLAAYRAHDSIKRSRALIEQYRREIGWLTERIEMLERLTPGALQFSPPPKG